MQISSRFTIALHIFACVETFKGTHKLTSDFLSQSINVNPVIIRKTLSQLKKAGLIHVARGTGGAELAKAADEMSLLDIYQAVECLGSTGQLFGFHDNPNPACPIGHNIHNVLDGKLEDIQTAMEKEMSQTTLKDVVEDTQKRMKLESVS